MADMVLVEETLDWIENNPERWDQGAYVKNTRTHNNSWNTPKDIQVPIVDNCGTTLCFGGAALMLRDRLKFIYGAGDTWYVDSVDADGNHSNIHVAAREVLQLTEDEARNIFYCFYYNDGETAGFRRHVYKVLGVTKG